MPHLSLLQMEVTQFAEVQDSLAEDAEDFNLNKIRIIVSKVNHFLAPTRKFSLKGVNPEEGYATDIIIRHLFPLKLAAS